MNENEGVVPMLTDSSILIDDDSEISGLNQVMHDDSPTLYQLEDDSLGGSSVYLFASLPSRSDITGSSTSSSQEELLYNDPVPVKVQVIQSQSTENQIDTGQVEVQQFFTTSPTTSGPSKLFELKEIAKDDIQKDVVQCYVVGASQEQDVEDEIDEQENAFPEIHQQKIVILTDTIEDAEKLCQESETNDALIQTSSPNKDQIPEAVVMTISPDPPLLMTCQVFNEFQSVTGNITHREVMTQTMPPRKTRIPKKRKLNVNVEEEQTNPESEAVGYDKPFRCPHCNLRFGIDDKLALHVKCHIPNSSDYRCFKCDFTCPQWIKIYHHLFTHGIEKPHKCSKCSFSCINNSILLSHMAVHNKSKDWTCDKCGRPFKHRRNMVAHLRTCNGVDEHGNPRVTTEKHVCTICDRKLLNHKNLQKHMEIHSNIKPYVCDVCGHTTRLKESLIMHKRIHTGEKPFQCNICDYATPDKSSLRRHKRQHTNEKPYSCPTCTYKCIQKHCLDTHIRRKHTGERFVCGICHYATHNRYTLNQHFKRHEITGTARFVETPVVNKSKIQPQPVPIKPNVATDDTVEDKVLEGNDGQEVVLTLNEVPEHSNDDPLVHEQLKYQSIKSFQQTTKSDLSLTETVLQEINQPGDQMYIQTNGDILVQRSDGGILILQLQDDSEENEQKKQIIE